MFTKEEYVARRASLKRSVRTGVILLLGNNESGINFKNNWYPFRQDSTFLYYFGIERAGLSAIIDIDNNSEILFGNESSIDEIIFAGLKTSLKDMAEEVGVIRLAKAETIKDVIDIILNQKRIVHFLPPYRPEHGEKLNYLLGKGSTQFINESSVQLIKAIVNTRSIKTAAEIREIEKAVGVTGDMQLQAMKSAKMGISERILASYVNQIAYSKGRGLAFPTILTINGQVLHNYDQSNILQEGEMVLCDCGAEVDSGYCGDLTRTFPVSPGFSTKQKEIYEIVYSAYQKAVQMAHPDILFMDVHLTACYELVNGLKAIGLMKGDPVEAVQAGAHTLFFQCGLGHMMGLDVHDMENLGEEYVGYTDTFRQRTDFGFKLLRLGKKLEAGNVITIEPGIYMIPELIELRKSQKQYVDFVNYDKLDVYKKFGGIRIEDDFLITGAANRILGIKIPTKLNEIEDARRQHLK